MSYRVLVVVGNAQGAGGFGVGKALDPASATARAIRAAKKQLVVVDRFKQTALVHSVEGRHNSCRVVLRAVPPGKGQKGGNVAKAILTQMGIRDVTAKATGRRHPFAVVRVSRGGAAPGEKNVGEKPLRRREDAPPHAFGPCSFVEPQAIFKALARHTSLAEVSRTRGRRILEMEWRRGN